VTKSAGRADRLQLAALARLQLVAPGIVRGSTRWLAASARARSQIYKFLKSLSFLT
jgi:hypothetical protein